CRGSEPGSADGAAATCGLCRKRFVSLHPTVIRQRLVASPHRAMVSCGTARRCHMTKPKNVPSRTTPLTAPSPAEFDDLLRMIDAARGRALAAVNKELIDLYWNIGEHISRKIASADWGQGTVETLAEYIRRRQPNARGFSARNLWRMMQFFEMYRGQ